MQPHVTALHLNDPTSSAAPPTARPRRLLHHLISAALVVLLGVPTFLLGRVVWEEWKLLMAEESSSAASGIIGFRNIYPAISRAAPPRPWHRKEGDDLFVWAGWQHGQGHRWFRLGAGDCDLATLGDPIGRDVARAIVEPAIETGGGEIWERLPQEADVAGFSVGGTPCAYPRLVLAKVLVVNDVVDGTPCLILHDPFVGTPDVAVFDPRLDGRRITMGCSGFTVSRRQVIYDRETESLWADRGEGLVAFSGKHKGRSLPLVRRVSSTSWSDWQSEHPESRLLVGALEVPLAPAAK